MFQDKIKKAKQILKRTISQTFKLLWSFKWYILVYLLFYLCYAVEYFSPPEKDSPIWSSDAMEGDWVYTNQEVYIGSLKTVLVELLFLFLLGTSNMRNHPVLAKIIFLSPVIIFIAGLILSIACDI